MVLEVVIAIACAVRPWKLPWKTMMLRLLVACRASLTLASTASAPLLAKKNLSMVVGVTSSRDSAKAKVAGEMTMFTMPKIIVSACA